VLKDTLGLILAKTPEEKDLYDEAFDLFQRDDSRGRLGGGSGAGEGGMPQRGPQMVGDGMGGSGGRALGQCGERRPSRAGAKWKSRA